ncbi:hypothetical protein LEP1GSC026_4492 [Leptospira interrogans str. 2002000623]|uniref:Uncharacterized protein n=1 Tax=Leptospira interrogans str. UI 12758 TaxID=1049938 RepID=A0A0E2D6C7_LEPIR|nr:hypothetical protein LEP1GSC025_0816 [Leptospira interrogans str. 2002000621]EKQ47500.1 hypothetical protein LEP1GSC026_4492 [Leptospira interrogans str. 2002000623]EKR55115.1 hypothetical protein LEP1GSC105_2607 [Leptospira interrogans str. UI 12758]EMJ52448.1 hypothetical protein LEP1GSC013_2333 [Leptospira interrogans serovar Valbuzzi str. Duyster]EMN66837.1 hypothetical protein LEP1GSC098_3167 [Leptospira interrogans serovar Grippotyphosa str. UI 08434]
MKSEFSTYFCISSHISFFRKKLDIGTLTISELCQSLQSKL